MKFNMFWIKQRIKTFFQLKVLPKYYKISIKGKVNSKKVIFADAHNKTLPYSMELLHKKFTDEGFEVIDFICDYNSSSFSTILKNMFGFMKCYANAKYVIICDYFLPVSSADKRPETVVVQLWHACGMFKKFGYDAQDDISKDYKGFPSKNFDLVTVTSPICEKTYANAFHLPEKNVKSLGLSRTDCFFNPEYIAKCKEDFYRTYPQAKGKKIVLWAPTFRGNAGNPVLVGKDDIINLQSKLGNDWFVVTKLHPHFKNMGDFNSSIPTERLLPVTDVLISDYSTVIFEYLLFNRPLVLFVPDFDDYYSQRGFYFDYNELPGCIVKDGNKLADAIKNQCENNELTKIATFRNKYLSACDGNSTDRIFKAILKLGLGGDLNS